MRLQFLQLVVVVGCALLYFASGRHVSAQVVINEVMANPGTGNDWVELKNISDQTVNLSGWSIEDSNSLLTAVPSLSTQILAPSEYLVLEVSNRLNNTGDQVKLKNPANTLTDSFTFTQTTLDQSWARIADGVGEFAAAVASRGSANQSAIVPTPSPSPSTAPSLSPTPSPSPNPTPSPSPQISVALPTHIVVSEIMACPNTGENEWVEIQNLDLQPYELNSWQIKDSQGNARYFSVQISSQSFSVIPISPSMLNNTGGDQLSIVRPDGITTSWASYTTCNKGKSLVLSGDKWQPAEPTPGQENTETSVENTSEADDSSDQSSDDPGLAITPSPTAVLSTSSAQLGTTRTAAKKHVDTPLLLSCLADSTHSTQLRPANDANPYFMVKSPPFSPVLLFIPVLCSCASLSYSVWTYYAWYTERRAATTFLFD